MSKLEKKNYGSPPYATNGKGERVLPPGMTPRGMPNLHPGYKYSNSFGKRELSGDPLKNYVGRKLKNDPDMAFSELLVEFTNDGYHMPKAPHMKRKKKEEISDYYLELRKKDHRFIF